MPSAKEIGIRLARLRGNIPRERFANDIGVSVSAISMYENGERIPRDAIKIKISEYFGRSVQEIFFEEKSHDM